MQVVIVGNGILGLQTAYEWTKRDPHAHVVLVGPERRAGCASLAAAAMFNSFAELDVGTLSNPIEEKKWLFNRMAAPLWPSLLAELSELSSQPIHRGFGTYVINNHVSDSLEDENFDAIVAGLRRFDEPFEFVSPRQIPKYAPASDGRAGRALFIPAEGWVHPNDLFRALQTLLERSERVSFVDDACASVELGPQGRIARVLLQSGKAVQGDRYLLCPGANFSSIVGNSQLPVTFPRIFYGVGASLLLMTGPETLTHCVRTPNRGLACGVYAVPRSESEMLVGASNFISPVPVYHARATSVYTLLKAAIEQVNRSYYRAEVVQINVGWRPTSEDTLPLLGATAIDNLYVATGTKRDGLHCSPVIAKYLCDLMADGRSSYRLELFKPDRDPMRIYSRDEAIKTCVRQAINAAFQHDFVPAKNRMLDELEKHYTHEYSRLHDQVGAIDWGIPPEMVDMYRYGHARPPQVG